MYKYKYRGMKLIITQIATTEAYCNENCHMTTVTVQGKNTYLNYSTRVLNLIKVNQTTINQQERNIELVTTFTHLYKFTWE